MKNTINRESIKQSILSLQDKEYREFSSRLIPGDENIIGVRIPVLRQYAKELYEESDESIETLMDIIGNEYQEEIMLKGMLIGLQKDICIDRLLQQIENFVPEIRNWAVCDVFCSGLKRIRRDPERTYDFLQKYLVSDEEYDVRFSVVMLIDHYVNDEYIERILKKSDEISHSGYYVRMAVAWLISACFVKFYDKTINHMKVCCLDDFTYNKAIQKSIESRRLTVQQKKYLKEMKRRIRK